MCLSHLSSHFSHLLFSCLVFLPSLHPFFHLTNQPHPPSAYTVYQVSGMVLWPAPIILSYSLMQTGIGNLSIKYNFKSVIFTEQQHTHTHLREIYNNSTHSLFLCVTFLTCTISLFDFLLQCGHQPLTLSDCQSLCLCFSLCVLHKHTPVCSVSSSTHSVLVSRCSHQNALHQFFTSQ